MTLGCQLDENTRRYYLDAMGIQLWQSLTPTSTSAQPQSAEQSDGQADLSETIARCQACELHTGRKQALAGRGNPRADLMVVLLAPTPEDDQAGRLCSGAAGELLQKMLAAIDVDIDQVYLTSLFKCAHAGQALSAQQRGACLPYLQQQVARIQPQRLLLLGESLGQMLLDSPQGIDALREQLNRDENVLPLLGLPALLSYAPGELLQDAAAKRKAWADLQRLQALLET